MRLSPGVRPQPMNISSPPPDGAGRRRRSGRGSTRTGTGAAAPPDRCAAKWRATTGAIMKPWPRKPQHDVEAGHVGQLADDRVAVRADVVGPGPLAHDLHVAEARHQLDQRARHRGRERQPRAEAHRRRRRPRAAARCRRPARRAATATRRARSRDRDHRLQERLERLGRHDLVALRAVGKRRAHQARDLRRPGAGGADDPLGGEAFPPGS